MAQPAKILILAAALARRQLVRLKTETVLNGFLSVHFMRLGHRAKASV